VQTAAFAAVAPFEMVSFCKNHQTLFVQIKIFLSQTIAGGPSLFFIAFIAQYCAEIRVLLPLRINPTPDSFVLKLS